MDLLSGNVSMPGAQPVGSVINQQPAMPQVGVQQPVVGRDADGYMTVNGERMFTQAQLNSILGGRLANEKALQTQLTQSQQVASQYLGELNTYKQRDIARNAGVPEAYMGFVLFEANKLATGGKDFQTALNEVLAANGAIIGAPQGTQQQVSQPAQGAVQTPTQPGAVMQPQGQATQQQFAQQVAPAVQPVVGAGQGMQPSQNFAQPVQQVAPVVQPGVVPQAQPGFAGSQQPNTPMQVATGVQMPMVQQAPQLVSTGVVGFQSVPSAIDETTAVVNDLLVRKGVRKAGG